MLCEYVEGVCLKSGMGEEAETGRESRS